MIATALILLACWFFGRGCAHLAFPPGRSFFVPNGGNTYLDGTDNL
jgi:hypothetical protein